MVPAATPANSSSPAAFSDSGISAVPAGGLRVVRRRKLVGRELWCSARKVVAAGPGVVVDLFRDEDTGSSCRLGQPLGRRRRRRLFAERRRRRSPAGELALDRPPTKKQGGCVSVR